MSPGSWRSIRASGNSRQHNGNVYYYGVDPDGKRTEQAEKDQKLWKAAKEGQIIRVRCLLGQGASVDYFHGFVDEDGVKLMHTALHAAVINEHANVVRELIEAGADIQVLTNDDIGLTPLHLAVINGHFTIVQTLLEAGADVDLGATREHGDRPTCALQFAALNGHIEILDELLSAGAEVNCTALHWAAMHGDVTVIKKLLLAGAHVDTKAPDGGLTPLHYASRYGHRDAVDALILALAQM